MSKAVVHPQEAGCAVPAAKAVTATLSRKSLVVSR